MNEELKCRLIELLCKQTPEQKVAAERMSDLTRCAIESLNKRTPEQKAETARRMDAVASDLLGLPRDPDLWEEA